jgi:hypothetical protein
VFAETAEHIDHGDFVDARSPQALMWTATSTATRGGETTKLQQAAYDSQLSAGLPTSTLAHALLFRPDAPVGLGPCAAYIHAIQDTDWFKAAFTGHATPVTVVGGRGASHADAARRRVKIGTNDRRSVAAASMRVFMSWRTS